MKYGENIQECIEYGIPDKDGHYHFIGLITNVRFSKLNFNSTTEYFNVCSFETKTPLPKMKFNPYSKISSGTICGITIELLPLARYKFTADLVENEKYNEWQYKIVSVIEEGVSSEDIYDKYLKFIVTDNQYKLIKNACPDFVKRLEEDCNFRIPRLRGQTERSMNKIYENVYSFLEYKELIAKLGQFQGFTINTILSLSSLGNSPQLILQKIEENPYVLMKLSRFGWKRVDKLALTLKPELISSSFRLIAFCKSILEEISTAPDGGHTWIFINNPKDVKHSMAHLIKDNCPECKDYIKDYFGTERELTKTFGCGHMFYVDEDKIGLAKFFKSEQNILKHLKRIQNGEHLTTEYTLEEAVEATDLYMSINAGEELHLTEEQVDVIKSTLDNDVVILTAHAGAGKSTTIKGIIELWKDRDIACCALAAKAAIRIKEATGQESYTIHRLLDFKNGKFKYNEENPMSYDIIIIDECSMINVGLFLCLLRAVKSGAKVILVFDDAQLPAIGAGSVAKDLLTSNFCIKKLTKIHRQAAKSGIKIDANKIRKQIDVFLQNGDYDSAGELPEHVVHGERKDMHYYCLRNAEGVHYQTIMLYEELINGGGVGGEAPIAAEDISIIVPMKSKMINCTDTFNQEIQEILLKNECKQLKYGSYQDKDRTPRVFKLGCRVIRRKNDYKLNVFNGEQGTIIDISDDEKGFTVKFDDGKIVVFKYRELEYFDLAYALTVHSMQGSENKIIIFVMDTRHTLMLDSTLFYTAITRAKDMNFVIFQTNAYITAHTEDKVCRRQTFLPLLINGYIEDDKDIGAVDEEELFDTGGEMFD